MQFNLRGETKERNDNWWTPLGVVRIARAGWDTRLGPSDGAQTASEAVSFAPEILRDGHWVKLAELPASYEASWSAQFVNPAIVRCTLEYHPVAGQRGPVFRDEFILTPDGVLSSVERLSQESAPWGVTWPLLVDDGRPLQTHIAERIAETGYTYGSDTESFLAVDELGSLHRDKDTVRSSYGDLLPLRYHTPGGVSHTFVYPHDSSQPDAQTVLRSFRLAADGFQSVLGRVTGNVYVGRTFAGGRARQVDLDGDGQPDIIFSSECGFVARLRDGRVTMLEVDPQGDCARQWARVQVVNVSPRNHRIVFRITEKSRKPVKTGELTSLLEPLTF